MGMTPNDDPAGANAAPKTRFASKVAQFFALFSAQLFSC
jgi:hypothetical protein